MAKTPLQKATTALASAEKKHEAVVSTLTESQEALDKAKAAAADADADSKEALDKAAADAETAFNSAQTAADKTAATVEAKKEALKEASEAADEEEVQLADYTVAEGCSVTTAKQGHRLAGMEVTADMFPGKGKNGG